MRTTILESLRIDSVNVGCVQSYTMRFSVCLSLLIIANCEAAYNQAHSNILQGLRTQIL